VIVFGGVEAEVLKVLVVFALGLVAFNLKGDALFFVLIVGEII